MERYEKIKEFVKELLNDIESEGEPRRFTVSFKRPYVTLARSTCYHSPSGEIKDVQLFTVTIDFSGSLYPVVVQRTVFKKPEKWKNIPDPVSTSIDAITKVDFKGAKEIVRQFEYFSYWLQEFRNHYILYPDTKREKTIREYNEFIEFVKKLKPEPEPRIKQISERLRKLHPSIDREEIYEQATKLVKSIEAREALRKIKEGQYNLIDEKEINYDITNEERPEEEKERLKQLYQYNKDYEHYKDLIDIVVNDLKRNNIPEGAVSTIKDTMYVDVEIREILVTAEYVSVVGGENYLGSVVINECTHEFELQGSSVRCKWSDPTGEHWFEDYDISGIDELEEVIRAFIANPIP